ARAAWLSGASLNARLGARMLAKYPGVSVVGVLAMAIGIGLGAGYLEVVTDLLRPTLPLDEGERIVGLRNWDVAERDPELRSLYDFTVWREALTSVRDLSAFRTIERNVGADDVTPAPATGAEITPAAFRVARVPALRGRTLTVEDERPGAPPVVVLGYDLWQGRFGGAGDIVGRSVQIGRGTAAVVGVMPEDFAFPVDHDFWMPLRAEVLAQAPREGPAVHLFGRLAEGVPMARAQAELTAIGLRVAAEQPGTHERLRPRVMRYTELFFGGQGSGGPAMYMVVLLFLMVLLVLASNVATMVFARTATRESEIAMRYALGASRGQLLVQFFIESFVLALAATALGLGVVAWGAGWVARFFSQITSGLAPFWLDTRLTLSTVLYALVLAVIGSVVAGVLPAFKVTAGGLYSRMRHPAGEGAGSVRFGGIWSAVIVVQVAFAVLLVPPAVVAISSWAEPQRADAGFATHEYLSARIELDFDRPPSNAAEEAAYVEEFQSTREELRRRLVAMPEVSDVTFATALPGMDHGQTLWEIEGMVAESTAPVMGATVDGDFFQAFGARIIAGRGFDRSDLESDTRAVVVNQLFASNVLRGRNAVGLRLRPRGSTNGRWWEIVGVVENLGMDTDRDPFHPGTGPGIYFPLGADAMRSADGHEVRVAFRVRGDAASFAPQLRGIARATDPALRLHDVLPLDQPVDRDNRNQRLVTKFFTSATALVAVIALIISMAGIYSVLAFTVSRQTREIGIRMALGADRRRIIR
ncbi:MAG TPA: ABC transporter permease, partial [Longimicrobiales bacterium]|nr:ABC transporter permease [Longimicrobiales bacterium]